MKMLLKKPESLWFFKMQERNANAAGMIAAHIINHFVPSFKIFSFGSRRTGILFGIKKIVSKTPTIRLIADNTSIKIFCFLT